MHTSSSSTRRSTKFFLSNSGPLVRFRHARPIVVAALTWRVKSANTDAPPFSPFKLARRASAMPIGITEPVLLILLCLKPTGEPDGEVCLLALLVIPASSAACAPPALIVSAACSSCSFSSLAACRSRAHRDLADVVTLPWGRRVIRSS
eukprot:3008482-Rhodomonas_salina.2